MKSVKEKDKDKEKEKDKYLSNKKRKLRRNQTLNMANVPTDSVRTHDNKELNLKLSSQNTLSHFNNILKEPIFSTKFSRPSKFVIINNNNIILRKKNSLFEKKSLRKKERVNVKFSEEIKEEEKKRKNKPRKSFIRNGKNTVKIINSDFSRFKLFSE